MKGHIINRRIPGLSFKKIKRAHARQDVRMVTFRTKGKRVTGFTMRGGESTYCSLTDSNGNIVGWEHSYCHEPTALLIEDGVPNKMSQKQRDGLTHGKYYRAVWEKTGKDEFNPRPVPKGKIIAFIPVADIK